MKSLQQIFIAPPHLRVLAKVTLSLPVGRGRPAEAELGAEPGQPEALSPGCCLRRSVRRRQVLEGAEEQRPPHKQGHPSLAEQLQRHTPCWAS